MLRTRQVARIQLGGQCLRGLALAGRFAWFLFSVCLIVLGRVFS